MKKFFVALLTTVCLFFLSFSVGNAQQVLSEFNEYGIVKGNQEEYLTSRTLQSNTEWEVFPSKNNVELNNVWTVTFNDTVAFEKIDAIVIERNNEFVPVTITKNAQKQLQVSPAYGFSGNTNYQMKIFLANGLKYKMDFKTKGQSRVADIEDNNTYVNASTLYLNETISGKLSSSDRSDYYKIEVPADGTLSLTALNKLGGSIDLYLYGVNGNDNSSIRQKSGTTANVSAGLQAGTYYVRVSQWDNVDYDLIVSFTENTVVNDQAAPSYILANEVKLNNKITGHIGYTNQHTKNNVDDYYKLIIPQDGLLTLKATQLSGGDIDMYFYGVNGNDGSYIGYKYNFAKAEMSYRLAAGTYYVRLNESGYYGTYELETLFTSSPVANDVATEAYILAPKIDLNSTTYGHLGYTYENVSVNNNDYYKVEIEKSGTLTIKGEHLTGNDLDLYLYGENGSDGRYLKYVYNQTQATITHNVTPGTYYIRLNNSGNSGDYELKVLFE